MEEAGNDSSGGVDGEEASDDLKKLMILVWAAGHWHSL